ncbi:MAG: response regulator [Rhabdochlamydiaceae bacterium]|nr:response regulator [Rhabdochlamydiaceae bacterium]
MTQKEDLLHTFSKVYGQLSDLAAALIFSLNPFLEVKGVECALDIKKVYEASLLLKKKAEEFLNQKILDEQIQKEDFAAYLTHVRHDLRNVVNVINGYGEMILEEMQNEKLQGFRDQFVEILAKVAQILALIDQIKLQEHKAIHPSPAISFDLKQESQEFSSFKEKISILIIDDNLESCEILKRYLKNIGYSNTQTAHNGALGLALLEKQPIDLILLDIDMPEMNGIEVLEHLKDEIIHQKLMVLMISAADTLENTIECIKLGAEDFLPKPFNSDLLRVRIGSCVEKRWFIRNEKKYHDQLKSEKLRYEGLMRAVFPSVIVEQLARTGTVKPANYANVAIVFADVVSFTAYCDSHEPNEVLHHLQDFAEMCESVAIEHHVQKIKTIGDSFLGSSGMLIHRDNPVLDCLMYADNLLKNSAKLSSQWQLRVGIHFGSVIGGIVGHRQYQFDIWGDVVNTAARIQTQAEPNRICLSHQAWQKVRDLCMCRSLGLRTIRGKAPLEIFEYVSDKRPNV